MNVEPVDNVILGPQEVADPTAGKPLPNGRKIKNEHRVSVCINGRMCTAGEVDLIRACLIAGSYELAAGDKSGQDQEVKSKLQSVLKLMHLMGKS